MEPVPSLRKINYQFVSGASVVKDSKGNVTGFKKVNGKYITKTISKKKV
jgi:hypothetical protein